MNRQFTGIILAGGKSSRMGKDKGLMEFRGRPLISHAIELLTVHCQELLISTGNTEYKQFGLPLVPDLHAEFGPMGGIYSAMQQISGDWSIVLACDMPFVNHQLCDLLKDNAENSRCCIVPEHDGLLEPLAAMYHRRIIPEMENALELNQPSLYRLFQTSGAFFLSTDQLLADYPDLFANLNAPEDLKG